MSQNQPVKIGVLSKRGTGYFYKPWASRTFRLYASDATLTYETLTGELKGRVKLQEPWAYSISLPLAENKSFAFKAYVRKFESDGRTIATVSKELVLLI